MRKSVEEMSNREIHEEMLQYQKPLPYLECDECGAMTYDLTWLGEIHGGCGRQGAMRLVTPRPPHNED